MGPGIYRLVEVFHWPGLFSVAVLPLSRPKTRERGMAQLLAFPSQLAAFGLRLAGKVTGIRGQGSGLSSLGRPGLPDAQQILPPPHRGQPPLARFPLGFG